MALLPFFFVTFMSAVFLVQAQFELPAENLCFAGNPQTTQTKDAIYFMGSTYTLDNSAHNFSYGNTLFAIPLNVSFDVGGPLSSNSYRTISAPDSVPTQEGGLFKDAAGDMLYRFAGFNDLNQTTPSSAVSTFNLTSETWDTVDVFGGDYNIGARWGASWANSEWTEEGLGFFLGGFENIPGLITFDSKNVSWTNVTDDTTPRPLEAKLVYTRYGSQGSLIMIGGYNKNFNVTDYQGNTSFGLRNTTNIGVYDVASGTWYNVTAEGDIPPRRSNFCAAASTAPDSSSINIMMYGGYENYYGTATEEVYILSIPSFRWFNVTPSANSENDLGGGNPVGRQNHNCEMFQDRQLISVGGSILVEDDVINRYECDNSWDVVRVFDASTLTWSSQFDPNLGDYYVPEELTNVIGGNGTGGATVRSPSSGFPSGLDSVFTEVVAFYNASATSTTGSSSSNSSSSATSSSTSSSGGGSRHSSTGAVAGGVVGGVIGAALLIGLLLFFLRRRNRSRNATKPDQKSPPNIIASELDGRHGNSSQKYEYSKVDDPGAAEGMGTDNQAQEMGTDNQLHEMDTLNGRGKQHSSELPA